MRKGWVVAGIVGGLGAASFAYADALVKGKEASKLLGDLERHFSKGSYAVLVLERRDRQPIHLEPIDAIVLNPAGGSFKKVRSRDRVHRLLVDTPGGSGGMALTPQLTQRLLSLIKTNHMVPYVLKDAAGEEKLLVFADPYNSCTISERDGGIDLSVRERPSRRPVTMEEERIWFRVY